MSWRSGSGWNGEFGWNAAAAGGGGGATSVVQRDGTLVTQRDATQVTDQRP